MEKALNALDQIENYEFNFSRKTLEKCRFNMEKVEKIFHDILLENQQVLNSLDMYIDSVIFYHSGFGCQICNSEIVETLFAGVEQVVVHKHLSN